MAPSRAAPTACPARPPARPRSRGAPRPRLRCALAAGRPAAPGFTQEAPVAAGDGVRREATQARGGARNARPAGRGGAGRQDRVCSMSDFIKNMLI